MTATISLSLYKKTYKILLFVVVFFVISFTFASAEVIDKFNSTISINTDGSFIVTEDITYNFESVSRHGIFRYIPTVHPQKARSWYKARYTDITIAGVQRNGTPEPYELKKGRNQTYLKIGSPDSTITGEQIYTITYIVRGGLSYFDGGEVELYWNVTGNGWNIPIRNVRAEIVDSKGLLVDARSCYSGPEGVRTLCSSIQPTQNGVVFSEKNLGPAEGLTIAHALDASRIDKVQLERLSVFWIMLGVVIWWFVVLFMFISRYKNKYNSQQAIVAQYEPYKNFKPMYTGVLFDGTLDPKDITAGIIYLAQQGFLKLTKTESKAFFFIDVTDYEITLLKDTSSIGDAFQKEILKLLFGAGLIVGTTIKLGELRKDVFKRRVNQKYLKRLKKAVERSLEERDLFQITISERYLISIMVLIFIVVYIIIDMFSFTVTREVFLLLFAIIGTISMLLLFLSRRRTRKGYEALNYLLGFREFLSVTDRERFKFHNAPNKNPEQFMEYLPYAIAFGVEKEWAKVFKDIIIPNPSWYDGGASFATFSAVDLTTSIRAFATVFATSSGLASSGSGFSGGGGGGGGGGSW